MFFFHLVLTCLFILSIPSSASAKSSNIALRAVRKAAQNAHGFVRDVHIAFGAVLSSRQQSQVHLSSNTALVYCKSGSGSGGSESGASPIGNSSGSSTSLSVGQGSATQTAVDGAPTSSAVSTPWQLVEEHSGSNFFDGWTFTDAPDVTTDGIANYVDNGTATANNLTQITSDGNVIMRVETTQTVTGNRMSIRITTNSAYNEGLWILDAVHMPTGCGTWPAFWTNGPGVWPAGGEIDIVEGVNDYTNNQATLHTNSGCFLSSTSASEVDMSGTIITGTNCSAFSAGFGCGIRANSDVSYGAAFNDNGGGVFAMTLNSSGIAVYFFARDSIPSDISAKTPLPDLWDPPMAWWSSSACDTANFFGPQSTIFDTTLCGQLGDSVWSVAGAPGQAQSCATRTGVAACEDFVRNNGASFQEAYWEVKSVQIYQIPS